MKKIYKYQIAITDEIYLSMPKGAQVLSVQVQHDIPVIWALVDPDAPVVERHFHLEATGHQLPDLMGRFIGTIQILEGDLVFHLFERFGS